MPRGAFQKKALRLSLTLAALAVSIWFLGGVIRDRPMIRVIDKPVGSLSRRAIVVENRWGDTLPAEECRLVVRENRNTSGGNHVEIAFDRIPSTSTRPLAPVFVLAGGPGTSGRHLGRTEYLYLFAEIRKFADVILVDQRGTGDSIPNLTCSGSLDLPTDVDTDVEGRVLAALTKRMKACLDDFRNDGVDVASYNSRENADDLDEIRAALGYDEITPMGYSYGTELAMVYMRRHPEHVSGAIFSGPVAPDMALKLPLSVDSEFQGLDALVRRDKRLSRYVPDLVATMKSVHEELKQAPVVVKVPLMDAVGNDDGAVPTTLFKTFSLFKPNWVMTMGDIHLELIVQDWIGRDDLLGQFPRIYYELSRHDYHFIGNILRNFRRRAMLNAVLLTTNCATGYTADRYARGKAEERSSIFSLEGVGFGRAKGFCELCGIPRLGDEFLEPITSDKPVLFVVGTLDGRTPLENLPELQRRFPLQQTIIVENGGHNGLLDNAIRDGILAFLQGEPVPVTTEKRELEFVPPVPFQNSLVGTLHEKILNDGVPAALALYDTLRSEYSESDEYVYDFGVASLNALGYRLLGENRVHEAAAIFKRNLETFPDDANAYDSYAESLAREGRRDEAVKNYERSIELNFLNGNGYRALRQLK